MSYNSMTGKFEPDTVSGLTYRDTVTALQAKLDAALEELELLQEHLRQAIQNVAALRAELDHKRERIAELEAAIKRQSASAHTGMDAAAAEGRDALKLAQRLRAESRPEIVDSEREMNALLTEECERLRAELDRKAAECGLLFATSNRIITALRAELAAARVPVLWAVRDDVLGHVYTRQGPTWPDRIVATYALISEQPVVKT